MVGISCYKGLCDVQKTIDNYWQELAFASGDKKYDILREVYAYYKQATFDLEKSGANIANMASISTYIHHMAELIPNDTIIPIQTYDFSDERDITNIFDIKQLLDKIVYEERCRLFSVHRKYGIQSFEDIDPINGCRVSALSVFNMARSIDLDVKAKIIEPGYQYASSLYGGGCKHVIIIINFMGKSYLVDATYKQFFMLKRCIIDKIGAVYLTNPYPGTFMVMNESRRKTAEKILNDGWIELTDENMKNYFDGFTNFYRNGSYYENTLDFSYEPEYTAQDYWRFLIGLDNQVNHEGLENLGYQTRALKNPKMSFNKR